MTFSAVQVSAIRGGGGEGVPGGGNKATGTLRTYHRTRPWCRTRICKSINVSIVKSCKIVKLQGIKDR